MPGEGRPRLAERSTGCETSPCAGNVSTRRLSEETSAVFSEMPTVGSEATFFFKAKVMTFLKRKEDLGNGQLATEAA